MEDLSVRDLFAMLAMNGLIANNGFCKGVVPMSYDIADAMMNEKEDRDERTSN
jgi:hypothetical protein